MFSLPYNGSLPLLFQELGVSLKDISNLKIKEGSLEAAFSQVVQEGDA